MKIMSHAQYVVENAERFSTAQVVKARNQLREQKDEERRSYLRIAKAGLFSFIFGLVNNYLVESGLNEVIVNIVTELIQNLI